jgi:hypothetical protein
MAWTPVSDNQLQNDVDALKLKRSQYAASLVDLAAAQATLAAKQAVVDTKKAELNAAEIAVETDAISYKVVD